MPLLQGRVHVNSTTGAVLDLTDLNNNSRSTRSQVKGMGVFSSTSNRDSVATDLRTPFFYKKTDVSGWDDTDNWMSLSAITGGLPQGGETNELLAKTSGTDYESEWVNTIIVEDAELRKHAADPGIPTLTFSRKKTGSTLNNNDQIGRLSSVGYGPAGNESAGASLRFVATGQINPSTNFIPSRIELFIATSVGEEKALTVDQEKKLIFAGSDFVPTAVEGGMYFNTTNKAFFLGV